MSGGAITICLALIASALWLPGLSGLLKLEPPAQSALALASAASVLPLLLGQAWIAWVRGARDRRAGAGHDFTEVNAGLPTAPSGWHVLRRGPPRQQEPKEGDQPCRCSRLSKFSRNPPEQLRRCRGRGRDESLRVRAEHQVRLHQKEMNAAVSDGKITSYRVNAKITFLLDDQATT